MADPTQHADLVRWEVTRRRVQPGTKLDREALDIDLADGWEPFAVTWDGHVWDYHLRRRTDAR